MTKYQVKELINHRNAVNIAFEGKSDFERLIEAELYQEAL